MSSSTSPLASPSAPSPRRSTSAPRKVALPVQPRNEENYRSYGFTLDGLVYCNIQPGDTIKSDRHSYELVRKLGWGAYSTVWLVKDEARVYHAIKVYQSSPGCTEVAMDEVEVTARLRQRSEMLGHAGGECIPHTSDAFEHEAGNRRHYCVVSDIHGENLQSLNQRMSKLGLGLEAVRLVARQLIEAVDLLHRSGIIHADIKPSNILLRLSPADAEVVVDANLQTTGVKPRFRGTSVFPSQPLQCPIPPGVSAHAARFIERQRAELESLLAPAPPALGGTPPRGSLGSSLTSSVDSTSPTSAFTEPASPPNMTDELPAGEDKDEAGYRGDNDAVTCDLAPHEQLPELLGELDPLPRLAGTSFGAGFQGVVLVDFSNAEPCSSKDKDTAIVGAPAYRSPEAVLGKRNWTSAVDIWALGCVLYELATGSEFIEVDYHPLHADQLRTRARQLDRQARGAGLSESERRDLADCADEAWEQAVLAEVDSATEYLVPVLRKLGRTEAPRSLGQGHGASVTMVGPVLDREGRFVDLRTRRLLKTGALWSRSDIEEVPERAAARRLPPLRSLATHLEEDHLLGAADAEEFADFLGQLLEPCPLRRATAASLRGHPFLRLRGFY